jgi:hypothetical protein
MSDSFYISTEFACTIGPSKKTDLGANTSHKFDPASPFGGGQECGPGHAGGLQGLAAFCRV